MYTTQQFDLSNDGSLDRMEAKAVLRKLKLAMEPAEFNAWFAALDKDGSGAVEKEEFVKAVIALGASLDAALNKQGGRIWLWLWYDAVVVLLLVAFGAVAYAATAIEYQYGSEQEWVSKTRIYWLRAIYGWLCAPWLLLKVRWTSSHERW